MNIVTGSCLCGGVAFELSGAPLLFLYCHCQSCRRASGSMHNANLAFPESSLAWTRGENFIERFVDTAENVGYQRWFCRTCGSPVPKPSRNRKFWVVPSGTLDVDPGLRPQANIYWAERAPWYVPGGDLPHHDAQLPNLPR